VGICDRALRARTGGALRLLPAWVACASICRSIRPPRFHAVVVLAIPHHEIGTKMALTLLRALARQKRRKSDFLSPLDVATNESS
jgi:hypothetical protein